MASTTTSDNPSSLLFSDTVMFDGILDDTSSALILLFGWAGCLDRYLMKYSDFYAEKNYTVVRYTVDISKIRSFASYHEHAVKVYKEVIEKTTSSTIVCHLFSMHGCSLFGALWEIMDYMSCGDLIKNKFKGIIFDSSPANISSWQAATAISFAVMPSTRYGRSLREMYRLFLVSYMAIIHSLLWMRSQMEAKVYEKNVAFYCLLAISDLPREQLYIYSTADEICSANSIQQFIRTQKEKGVNTTQIEFTDSAHCQHLRSYPNEYKQACLNFVKSLQ